MERFFQTPPHNVTVDGPAIMLSSTWIAEIVLFGLGGLLLLVLTIACIYFYIRKTWRSKFYPGNERVARGVYARPGLHASNERVELGILGNRNSTFQTSRPAISTPARAIGSSEPPPGFQDVDLDNTSTSSSAESELTLFSRPRHLKKK